MTCCILHYRYNVVYDALGLAKCVAYWGGVGWDVFSLSPEGWLHNAGCLRIAAPRVQPENLCCHYIIPSANREIVVSLRAVLREASTLFRSIEMTTVMNFGSCGGRLDTLGDSAV